MTRCSHCGRPLVLNETAWACGPMFCSEECGVAWAIDKYEPDEYTDADDLLQKAKAYFHDIAEEINREDYGARMEYFTISDGEMTVGFEDLFENDKLVCRRVVDWYFGEPDLVRRDKMYESTAFIWPEDWWDE